MTEAPTDLARGRESGATHLTDGQQDALRAMLTEAQAEHRGHLELNDALVNALSSDTDDSAGRDRETARLAADRAREALADVDHALGRLDDATYGTCEACERPIPFERLEVIPEARHCVACPPAAPLR